MESVQEAVASTRVSTEGAGEGQERCGLCDNMGTFESWEILK